MSYDLYFQPRPGRTLSPEAFRGYFEERAHYHFGEESSLWYENRDTGVYFRFDHDGTSASFNINYFRPHTFGLEAEPELTHFVRHFDLLVSDPQQNGMGEGEYSPEGFLRGWNGGNEFGYSACMSHLSGGDSLMHLPAALVERVWRWNYRRATLQAQVGEELFVPLILFVWHRGQLRLMAAWLDGIPVALPDVDALILGRAALAPAGQDADQALADMAQLRERLEDFPRVEGETGYWLLYYEEVPGALQHFISGQPSLSEKLSVVPFDEVLDRELVEKYLTHS